MISGVFLHYLKTDYCTGWVLESWIVEIKKLRDDLTGWRQALCGSWTTEEIHRRVLDEQQPIALQDINK